MSNYDKNIGYISINRGLLINKLNKALEIIKNERKLQENIWLEKFMKKYNNQIDTFNNSWYSILFRLKNKPKLLTLEETLIYVEEKRLKSKDEYGNYSRKYNYKSYFAYYLEDEIYILLNSAKDLDIKDEVEIDITLFSRIKHLGI